MLSSCWRRKPRDSGPMGGVPLLPAHFLSAGNSSPATSTTEKRKCLPRPLIKSSQSKMARMLLKCALKTGK
ncbi:hypothetical protein RRG08_002308 [Elysia crispata]|uniref:Uncharacterized protein n=1 Tax=Elysia crispata TaxID=231223 RepID=A0AAE0ZB01_9GAST|nr:hypothetical protein RRG08_002308 [Elysia crispata]